MDPPADSPDRADRTVTPLSSAREITASLAQRPITRSTQPIIA
jgi:hypothetical protein